MVVNGSDPGAVFFRDTVTVQANTNYLFTAWILNLFKVTGYPNPELGVRILNPEGDVLYSATLGALIPVNTNAPEWKQDVYKRQENTESALNAAFTHFAKPFCTMKSVIITGKGNKKYSMKYPLNTCKRTRLLRRTAQMNILYYRISRQILQLTGKS